MDKEKIIKTFRKNLIKTTVFILLSLLFIYITPKITTYAEVGSEYITGQHIKDKQSSLDKKRERLEEQYENGSITDARYERELEKLDKEQEELNEEEERINNPINLISNIVEELLGIDIKIDGMYLKNVIYPEKNIQMLSNIYNELSRYIKSIALSVIALYALWYGFKIYILWKDGNPEESPKELVVRIMIAVALILTGEEIINIASTFVSTVINRILNITGSATSTQASSFNLLNTGIFYIILSLVYFFNYWKLMLGTLKMGIELYILRLGFPLACVNNINSHGNTWNMFITTLIKNYLGICVNVLLIGIGTRIYDTGTDALTVLWAVAFLSLANNSKELLNQFIVSSSNTDGNSAGMALRTLTMEIGRRAIRGAATGGAGALTP